MKKLYFFVCVLCAFVENINAQSLAINTDGSTANASALLDVKSTNKGMLVPRMSKPQRNAIVTPATGLLVYQDAPDSVGFYYFDGTIWKLIASNINTANTWNITGNNNITAANFIGTTNVQDVRFRVTNQPFGSLSYQTQSVALGLNAALANVGGGLSNISIGTAANASNTNRNYLIAIGDSALYSNTQSANIAMGNKALFANTTGGNNVALGNFNLMNNVSGTNNVAIGHGTLEKNAPASATGFEGSFNVGMGSGVLSTNTLGRSNTGIGHLAMSYNTTGDYNTAIGFQTLQNNTTANENTAIGAFAMLDNKTGSQNTAIGVQALYQDTSGSNNISVGYFSLFSNLSGNDNIAVGNNSLQDNKTGYSNIAIGSKSLFRNNDRSNLVAIGDSALFNNGFGATQSFEAINNTAIGSKTLFSNTTGSSNTAIGIDALYSNTSGNANTVNGAGALRNNSTGSENTAIGVFSMGFQYGKKNTAIGYQTMAFGFSTDSLNIAIGHQALLGASNLHKNIAIGNSAMANSGNSSSSIAIGNSALAKNIRDNIIAIGDSSLYNNSLGATLGVHGTQNTGVGSRTLYANTTGFYNTATGSNALMSNTTGAGNTANGTGAMVLNTTGNNNTVMGLNAIFAGTGDDNTAIGSEAVNNLITGNGNTGIGRRALFVNNTGSNNTAIGFGADVTAGNLTNATAIGYNAKVATSNSLVLGGTGADAVKVGIGTTSPASRLEVVGTTVATDTTDLRISAGFSGVFGPTRLSFISDKSSAFEWRPGFIESADNGGGFGFNGRLDFYTNGSGPANKFGRVKAMSIINDYVSVPNKIQFANTGANRKIELYQTVDNDHQYYGFGINGGTLRYQVDQVSSNHIFYAGTSATTSNELLRIQGTGDVGIGTSTAASAYGHGGTNKILELKNTAPAGGNVQSHLILSTSANSGSMGGITWVGTGLSGEQRTGFIGNIFETANQTRLNFYTRDNAGVLNERFYIEGTGNAWLAGTLTQASDARLKKNIQPLSSTLKNITQINGYTYNWINEQKDTEQQIGLLAQEVQKIYPQLVKQNNKGELSVNYTGLIPVMLEGMKEQQKQIDELKNIVQQLLKNK